MSDRDALDAFRDELADIEKQILPFNTFEALGVERQELRHSSFLAFLLDPHGRHGLGDAFLRAFLRQAAAIKSDAPFPDGPELEGWDYDHVVVECEWRDIDILLLDPHNRFVIIIENKIDSSQHSNQLERYYNLVQQLHPSPRWRYMGGIYLTPTSEASNHHAYRPISYTVVCEILDLLLQERISLPDDESVVVVAALTQYNAMLRRHIVSDAKLAEDCHDIYRQHKRAIDLIFRYRLDQKEQLHALLRDLIEQADSPFAYNYEPPNKGSIMVTVKEWDHFPAHHPSDDKWVLVLLFVFVADGIEVVLQFTEHAGDIRENLFALVQANQNIFHQAAPKAADWAKLYRKLFFHLTPYQEASEDELAAALKEQWDRFIEEDFQKISDLITSQLWFQTPAQVTSQMAAQVE